MTTPDVKTKSIESLPNEILYQIILICSASSVFSVCRTSHRFNDLVDNNVWRLLCEREFNYWGPEHNIIARINDRTNSTDWRQIFTSRWRKQLETTRLLDNILESQSGRIDNFQKIVDLGYDAKDCLLKHLSVNEDAEDWLARRWYSDAVLGCLHRSMAIQEWTKVHAGVEGNLEKALTAFDMFVLHERRGDFEETKTILDSIAQAIVSEDSEFDSQTPRQKALMVASYLTRHRLVGIRGRSEQTYHDIQNNFIGFALHDHNHASLPLQTAAIYCGVARRLGLAASPCALPFHVFVMVQPPQGKSLDGVQQPEGYEGHTNMYLDPFETDQEIDMSVLSSRLFSVGTPQQHHGSFFEPAPITDLVLRTGRNILTSVQENYRNNVMFVQDGIEGRSPRLTDLEGAFYGALWAALLFGMPPNGDGPVIATINRRAYLPPFVEHFETHFPMDAALIERHIIPTFQDSPECDQLRESVRVMRSVDVMPKEVKSRTKEISERVHFRVGQVFRHKRYNYIAVITGWDIECGANEHWMARMRVHKLQKGQNQSFYHVLVADKSVRYVAEENIELIKPEEPHSLMALAGRHFKRWDKSTRCFISNIKDEYPDD